MKASDGILHEEGTVIVDCDHCMHQNGWTPLCCACRFGFVEVVKLLLTDNRVDINKRDEVKKSNKGYV